MDVKRYWTILALILTFSLGIKLIRLDFPNDYYFDEVYHGFTATYYVDGNPEAYSMYHKNPPGKAVEWTHPPLAKLIMAGSMLIFSEGYFPWQTTRAFGWRFSSALFGTLAALFAALLAWQLFESAFTSLMTAFLLSIENLVFAQSRIAMNDAHLICFTFMCLYFYVRWRRDPDHNRWLWLAGTGLGLALSCKWSALFLFFIIGMDQMADWYRDFKLPSLKELLVMTAALVALPAAIYFASYTHFFMLGNTWDDLVRMHQSMWWYHTNLKATHPYMSKPWQWLLNLKPVWMHVQYGPEGSNQIQNIYNTGNSVILYLGLASVLVYLGSAFKDFNWKSLKGWRGAVLAFVAILLVIDPSIALVAAITLVVAIYTSDKLSWAIWFCLVAYFLVWLPWLYSPRIMLFYHYLPAIPSLCILLSRQLEKLYNAGHDSAVGLILFVAVLWFAVIYPQNTGVPMPRGFVESVYYLIPSWK